MLYMAGYDNWNPEHFLDVAEMTMALSIGYDWLYEVLSPKNRAKIRKAILDKGLKPSMDKRYNGFWIRQIIGVKYVIRQWPMVQ